MGFDRNALDRLLDGVIQNGADSLHLIADRPPLLRLRGKKVPFGKGDVAKESLQEVLGEFVSGEQHERLDNGEEVELLFTAGDGERFRIMLFPAADGLNAVFTRMPAGVPSFEELGLPGQVASFVGFRSGLVIVNGFLGSGKSTTLAALVDCINKTASRHIVSVEDSIEFVHKPDTSLIHQREIGSHVASFAQGVRDATRQCADVIVVSDIPDSETFGAVLDAAERGRLVLTTMRVNSVLAGLERLESMCPPDQVDVWMRRLAGALKVSMSQVLLERVAHRGRVPLVEILINNESVQPILATRDFGMLAKIMAKSRGIGMQTVDDGLRSLLTKNLISREEALYHAHDREAV